MSEKITLSDLEDRIANRIDPAAFSGLSPSASNPRAP